MSHFGSMFLSSVHEKTIFGITKQKIFSMRLQNKTIGDNGCRKIIIKRFPGSDSGRVHYKQLQTGVARKETTKETTIIDVTIAQHFFTLNTF